MRLTLLVVVTGLWLATLVAPAPATEPAPKEPSAEAVSPAAPPPEGADAPPADDPPAEDLNPGLAEFEQATEKKISAEGIQDLGDVVDLLDAALEKGLDEANQAFAEEMLLATLMQRAEAIAGAVLNPPGMDARRVQLRSIAITDLQRVVSLRDDHVEAHLLIGRLQSLPLGDPGAARRSLTKVIKAKDVPDEQRAQAYALRGATQRDVEMQLSDFTEAAKLAPEKAEYRLLSARVLQGLKRYKECAAELDKAIELAPDNATVYEMKALVLLEQEKLEEALKAFDKASQLAPDSVQPYQLRGEVFNRLGDFEKGIAQLDKAIEMEPDNLASLLIRAELKLKAERAEEALQDIEAALRKQPGLLRAHLLRTHALEALGRGEEALEALEKLADAAPNQAEIQLQLAVYYMDAQRPTPAIEALTRVLKTAGDNELALRMRGDMYLSVGKHPEALADFTKAFELNPEDAGLLNNYAWTLATSPFDELRNGKRAVELAEKACEMTEYKKAHILSTLAAAHAEAGDFESAIKWAEKAVEIGEQGVDDQLRDELASYRSQKPWRELQQESDAEPQPDRGESDQPSDEVAPAGALDF